MCTAEVVVDEFAAAASGPQRVLDVGAGNGIGGERLRAAGVERLVGLDLEPMARTGATRDRPGLYDDYLIGDLTTMALDGLTDLTAVVALSAVGVGHLPAAALERVLGVLEPGGLFAFAVTPALMPGSDDPDGQATGYPELLDRLLAGDGEVSRRAYVHRRQTDGTPHHAIALVGRVNGA
jgi:SAM-dependent methyltransferase